MHTNDVYKQIIQNAPFGFAYHKIILNDEGKPYDYRFLEINQAFARLTGLNTEKLIGYTVREAIPGIEDDAFDWISFFGRIALDGGEEVFEQFSKPLNRWYNVQAFSSEKYFFYTVFTDITSNKEHVAQLAQTEKRYKGMLESQSDLIVRIDNENRFTYVNKAYCLTFGRSRKELIGSNFMPLVHEDDREATQKAMEQLQVPPYRCYLEQRAMTVNGWRWFAWEDSAILDDDGNIIEVQGVGRDITRLKEKEEALFRKTSSLQTILQETPAIIYSFTIQNGIPDVQYISENIINILGYEPEVFYHELNLWYANIHPDDQEKLNEIFWQRVNLMEPDSEVSVDYRLKDKNGTYRWLSDRSNVFTNRMGETEIVGCWIDVTNEKLKTEELFKYKQRLALAQSFARTGSWEYDTQSAILYWSKECEALFGLEEGTFEGTFNDFLKRVHPDDKAYVLSVNMPITEQKQGIALDYEHRIIRVDGETIWVKETAGVVYDQFGTPVKIVGFIADITKEKIAAEAIENEEKLRQIVNNIDGVFWLMPADRNEILYVSPAIEKIFNITQQQLYQHPDAFIEVIHPDDKDRVVKAWEQFYKTGDFNEEYRILRSNGEIRWVVSNTFPVNNKQGEIIRHGSFVRDITARKTTEILVRDQAERLKALISAMPDMIFIMHRDGTILDILGADQNKLITAPEDLLGRTIHGCFDEHETLRHLELYGDCIE
jgi:PAS domain S-box-containing protein